MENVWLLGGVEGTNERKKEEAEEEKTTGMPVLSNGWWVMEDSLLQMFGERECATTTKIIFRPKKKSSLN